MATKLVAACLFRHAVRKAIAGLNRLNTNAGRSEDDLQRYVRKLMSLAKSDPENEFWLLLGKANLKLLRYVSHRIR